MSTSRAVHIACVILFAAFIGGCATTPSPPRVIHDAHELLVRVEPAQTCTEVLQGMRFSHPLQLSGRQIRMLLASLLAREKIGLLSSFVQAPGTPRLFNDADLDRLTPPIQKALAQARPEEAVVFLLTTPVSGARSTVTSGALSIRDEMLSITLFNFKHPVHTTLSDIGATDRLSDVRETLQYVRQFPCVSIGEQDFALFFEEPSYQAQTRSGSLVRYPERTLSIAYSSFLTAHSRAIPHPADNENRLPRSLRDSTEHQTIENLTRRITELEQANQALAAPSAETSVPALSADLPKQAIDKRSDLDGETQQRLLDLIKKLEMRISELERLQQGSPPR